MQRNVAAIAAVSEYQLHYLSPAGGSFPQCVCPKQRCGGVADYDYRLDCPEHRLEPVQKRHWAAECPGGADA